MAEDNAPETVTMRKLLGLDDSFVRIAARLHELEHHIEDDDARAEFNELVTALWRGYTHMSDLLFDNHALHIQFDEAMQAWLGTDLQGVITAYAKSVGKYPHRSEEEGPCKPTH